MIYAYSLPMTDAPDLLIYYERNNIIVSVDWFCPSCVMVVWLLRLRTGRINSGNPIRRICEVRMWYRPKGDVATQTN